MPLGVTAHCLPSTHVQHLCWQPRPCFQSFRLQVYLHQMQHVHNRHMLEVVRSTAHALCAHTDGFIRAFVCSFDYPFVCLFIQ